MIHRDSKIIKKFTDVTIIEISKDSKNLESQIRFYITQNRELNHYSLTYDYSSIFKIDYFEKLKEHLKIFPLYLYIKNGFIIKMFSLTLLVDSNYGVNEKTYSLKYIYTLPYIKEMFYNQLKKSIEENKGELKYGSFPDIQDFKLPFNLNICFRYIPFDTIIRKLVSIGCNIKSLKFSNDKSKYFDLSCLKNTNIKKIDFSGFNAHRSINKLKSLEYIIGIGNIKILDNKCFPNLKYKMSWKGMGTFYLHRINEFKFSSELGYTFDDIKPELDRTKKKLLLPTFDIWYLKFFKNLELNKYFSEINELTYSFNYLPDEDIPTIHDMKIGVVKAKNETVLNKLRKVIVADKYLIEK